MDRLKAMEVYARVLEAGSLSAAARAMRLSQPAVSKAIAGLEARLGVRLLARSTRRIAATEAGQAFYERVLRALAEAEEAEIAARGVDAALEGRLRVSAPVTFARLHMAPKLGAFLERHPRLALDLIMDDRPVDMLGEAIDVAFRLGAMADSALTARKMAEAPRLLVASPAYVARRGGPQRPRDLAAHDLISYTQNADADEWRFARKGRVESVAVSPRLACSAAEGVRAAVITGLGLAIASRWMMAPELDSGAVTPVMTEWSLAPIALWAVFPPGRLPTAKARAFATWFEDTL